jgi:hypothetical protein
MAEVLLGFVTVFWMVVGWRAMKAHEQIADAVSQAVRGPVQLFRTDDQADTPGDA